MASLSKEPKQQPMLLYLAAFVLLGLVVANRLNLYIARRRMKQQNNCKPCPYVYNKDPLLGIDVLKENIQNFKNGCVLEKNRARLSYFGPQCTTFHNRMVNSPIIITVEPENVKTILSLKFKDYSLGNRSVALAPFLGDGIFNSDGHRWQNSRHLLRPNFAREQVADLDMLERHFKLMLKYIPKDGTTVDLQELFFRMTMDTATEFLFNHSTNVLKAMGQENAANEDIEFEKSFNFAQADALNRLRLGIFDKLRKNVEGNDAIRICHAYVDKWVDDAVEYYEAQKNKSQDPEKKLEDERYVFIHELAKQTNDKRRIRDELMNVLLAGRDTTASLLSNMFFQIAMRPDVWKKLKEEVATLGGRMPTYEELRNLKYVKWCLNESLRLHPVVPTNSRLAIKDTVLPRGGGPDGSAPLFVPKGTSVGYSTYSMHRRHDVYGPDADEFKPERWETLRPGWEYLPFNGGPRICLGQQYALTEASFVTVRLVQEFARMESRDPNGGVWVEGLTLTVCSKNGVQVAMYGN